MAKQTTCPSCQASIQLADDVPDGALLRCRKCRTQFRLGESQAASALRGAEQGGQVLPREPRRDQVRRKRELPIWALVLGGVAGLAVLALVLLMSVVDTSRLKPEPTKPEPESRSEQVAPKDDAGTQGEGGGGEQVADRSGDEPEHRPDREPPDDDPPSEPARLEAEMMPQTGPWTQYSASELPAQDFQPTSVHQDTPALDVDAEAFDTLLDKGRARSLPEIEPRNVSDLDWTLRSCVDGPGRIDVSDWIRKCQPLPMDWAEVTSMVPDADSPWAALTYRPRGQANGWLETRSLRDGSVGRRLVLPAGWAVAQVDGRDRVLLLDTVVRSPLLRWSVGQGRPAGEKFSVYPEDEDEGPLVDWARIALDGQVLAFHRGGQLHVASLGGAMRGWTIKGVREIPALAPGGRLLAVVAQGGVWLLEIESGEVVRQLARNLNGPVWSSKVGGGLFFSPRGERLGWIRPEGELWTWDLMAGRDTSAQVWQGRRDTPPAAAITDDGWVMLADRVIHPDDGRTVWRYEMRGLLGGAIGEPTPWVHGPDGRFWYFADQRQVDQAVLCAAHLPLLDQQAILTVWRDEPTSVTPGASLAVKVESPLASGALADRARRALDRAGLEEAAESPVELRVEVRAIGSGEPVDYVHEDGGAAEKVHARRWVIRVRMVQDGRTLWQQPWKMVADETRLRKVRIPAETQVRAYLDDLVEEKLVEAMRGLSLPALVTGRGQGASGQTRLRLHTTPPRGKGP
jgi:hypothetical protein